MTRINGDAMSNDSDIYKLIKITNIPFFITILFAVGGWIVTHLSDRILSSPVIEYSENETLYCGGITKVYYEISNISHDTAFESFEIQILCKEGKFYKAEKIFHQPLICDQEIIKHPNFNELHIPVPKLHPGAKLGIEIFHNGKKLQLYYSNKSSQSILLKQKGVETFIIKYEIILLCTLFVVWIFTIFIYLYIIS
jgi:hypothetical protein